MGWWSTSMAPWRPCWGRWQQRKAETGIGYSPTCCLPTGKYPKCLQGSFHLSCCMVAMSGAPLTFKGVLGSGQIESGECGIIRTDDWGQTYISLRAPKRRRRSGMTGMPGIVSFNPGIRCWSSSPPALTSYWQSGVACTLLVSDINYEIRMTDSRKKRFMLENDTLLVLLCFSLRNHPSRPMM